MHVSNMDPHTSWQDLKDLGKEVGAVLFAERNAVYGVLDFEVGFDINILFTLVLLQLTR